MPITDQMIEKLAASYLADNLVRSARTRTAGEIRHVKDLSGGARQFLHGHKFRPADYKMMAKALWQVSVALGHVTSATSAIAKLKSVHITPDGVLGGEGYKMKMTDIRADMASIMNTLSQVQDTFYDELAAPHWQEVVEKMPKQERKQLEEEVEEVLEDVDSIRSDPEQYAEEEYQEEVVDDAQSGDT